jgi:hypothetical protein
MGLKCKLYEKISAALLSIKLIDISVFQEALQQFHQENGKHYIYLFLLLIKLFCYSAARQGGLTNGGNACFTSLAIREQNDHHLAQYIHTIVNEPNENSTTALNVSVDLRVHLNDYIF